MNDATTVGLDPAKQHFSIFIMDAHGRIKSRHKFKRPALATFLHALPLSLSGPRGAGTQF